MFIFKFDVSGYSRAGRLGEFHPTLRTEHRLSPHTAQALLRLPR